MPDILYLEEPFAGLDFESKLNLIKLLTYCTYQYGKGIVFTSSSLEDIESLCNKIAIMDEGELIAFGGLNYLQ